jgi:hypothetical protein
VLLAVQTAPGAPSKIPPESVAKLIQRLQNPEGFRRYREIQQWLADECQLEVSDSVLSKLVHDHLQAQLKVARPQALEQSPSALQQFRTTLKPALQALPELVGPTPTVRYVCQDESRFGLHTVSGRVMTLKGVKPVGRCQWPRVNFYYSGNQIDCISKAAALDMPGSSIGTYTAGLICL